MQLDRLASEYALELQLTPSGQANESADFFWNESAFCACVKATFWSNLSKRAFARSFAWVKFQMLEVTMSRNSRRSFPLPDESSGGHRQILHNLSKYPKTLVAVLSLGPSCTSKVGLS
jgi:hypothetical protein